MSPEELKNNPFKKITVKEEKRTRKGVELKEVEKVQWIEPVAAGKIVPVQINFNQPVKR